MILREYFQCTFGTFSVCTFRTLSNTLFRTPSEHIRALYFSARQAAGALCVDHSVCRSHCAHMYQSLVTIVGVCSLCTGSVRASS